jgi:hypothetical protein
MTNIIEALEEAAADLAAEVLDQEDAEVTPDLDAEIKRAEEELAVAEAVEEAVAGSGTVEEHHRAADSVRFFRRKLERLRTQRAEQLAQEAERRRQEATAAAERLLVEEHPLDHVVAAYREATASLDALVAACATRQTAIEDAARLLRRVGVSVPSGPPPSVTLPGSGLHGFGDAEAGPMVAELIMDIGEKHNLTSQGGTKLSDVLARVAPRVSRGRVARLAKRDA